MTQTVGRIAHVGVLVNDLELSRDHWSTVMGCAFSPVFRYRMASWSDFLRSDPHPVELRQSISFGCEPWVQLIEFAQNGSHGRARGEGGHHVGFAPVDGHVRRVELAGLGLLIEGASLVDGRWLIQFTKADVLDGVITEWVESSPLHDNMKDDRSPLDVLPDGSPSPFPPELFEGTGGHRPWSGITEIDISVADLESAIPLWSSVLDDSFDVDDRSALSRTTVPRIRLTHAANAGVRRGFVAGTVQTRDLDAARTRLQRGGVPATTDNSHGIVVAADYLNGLTLRLVQA